MQMIDIPFGITDWSAVERTEHKGESGVAYWQTRHFGAIRVRVVEYTPGYLADHWCVKGHILFCLEGELRTELKDGRVFTLKPGMSQAGWARFVPTRLASIIFQRGHKYRAHPTRQPQYANDNSTEVQHRSHGQSGLALFSHGLQFIAKQRRSIEYAG